MLHIIIASHGPLAEAMIQSASMIYGKLPNTSSVTLQATAGIEQFRQDFAQVLQQVGQSVDGVLVLCDLQSGTPYNVACYHAFSTTQRVPMAVLSGVNLPLLLMSIDLIDSSNVHAVAQQLLLDAAHSIVYAEPINTEQHDDF